MERFKKWSGCQYILSAYGLDDAITELYFLFSWLTFADAGSLKYEK